MSGVNVGLSGSYGNEDTKSNSTTNTSGSGTSLTDFMSALNELVHQNTRSTTELPAWAKAGAKQNYETDLAASNTAKDWLLSLLSNPYGDGTGKFAPQIDKMFAQQLGKARTGDATSTGVARQGYREGEALAGAQRDWLTLGNSAATSLLDKANPNASLSLIGALAPKSNISDSTRDQTNKGNTNTATTQKGKSVTSGESDTSSWGVGGSVGCCFIFLETYNGVLPDFVRRCRDEFATGARRDGYNVLAAHLVPAMRRSRAVRGLVNWLMVKPMTNFGGWLYGKPKYHWGWIFSVITAFWFAAFSYIGKQVNSTSVANYQLK